MQARTKIAIAAAVVVVAVVVAFFLLKGRGEAEPKADGKAAAEKGKRRAYLVQKNVGKQFPLEWADTSGGLLEWWHDPGVPLAFPVESASS